MELFHRTKVARLRSHHNKFLTALEDGEGVKQTRHGSSKAARWMPEAVEGKPNAVMLKSLETGKYLSASDEPFLFGMTGQKVVQESPRLRSDPSLEWEPLKDGSFVRLRTKSGNYLRANSGIPPWMNSVTHDVPSRSHTKDWVLWMVDILEIDKSESQPSVKDDFGTHRTVTEARDEQALSRNSSTSSGYWSTASTIKVEKDDRRHKNSHEFGSSTRSVRKEDRRKDYDDVRRDDRRIDYDEVRSVRKDEGHHYDKVRSVHKGHKDYDEVGSPARSVRSSMEIPGPTPRTSPKSIKVSPLNQHVEQESNKHTISNNNKHKPMLDGVNNILNDEDGDIYSDADSDCSSEGSTFRPHQLDIVMAKEMLKDLKNMAFSDILSSGRDKKLEKALNILTADAMTSSSKGNVPKDLAYLQDKLNSMRSVHESASQDMVESSKFSTKRVQTKAELKKDAAKAHELETMDVGFINMLGSARAKRDELVKQLEEIENSIKAAERTQADNAVEMEEIISRIGEKSESLREMEKMDKSWQERKVEAERTLERVEEEWVQMKSLFQDA